MLNIVKIEAREVFIPFRTKYGHALKMHNGVSSIICKVYDKSGLVGYGESVPREYVTGESCKSVIEGIKKLSKQFIGRDLTFDQFNSDLLGLSKSYSSPFPSCSFCALEGAILDLFGKRMNKSITKLFADSNYDTLTYSGSIGMGNRFKIKAMSSVYKIMGFKHFKIKVGDDSDLERIKLIKNSFSSDCQFFADANCAWDKEEAIKRITELHKLGITAIEEPLKPKISTTYSNNQLDRESILTDSHYKDYKWLRDRSPIPLIADESLISMSSLNKIIDNKSFDILNIRLSKCGGLTISSEMIRLAEENGLKFSICAMVAESPILANFGSHFGCINNKYEYIQGHSHKALHSKSFTKGGGNLTRHAKVKLNHSLPGLGIEVNDNKLKKITKYLEVIK